MRNWNRPTWTGLLLSIVAFISYFVFFARFPFTRDVPWASFLLFAAAIALLVTGIRRADGRRIVASAVTIVGIAIFAAFAWVIFAATRHLPISTAAPRVGQVAPQFTLSQPNGKPTSLAEILQRSPKGVMLVFYRGYW
jgi:hypothetical protein